MPDRKILLFIFDFSGAESLTRYKMCAKKLAFLEHILRWRTGFFFQKINQKLKNLEDNLIQSQNMIFLTN